MTFKLTVLGSSSATPTSERHPTAQVLNVHERFFLIDCGEATQIQLRKFRIRFQRINNIFISHLHGDHYLGLMGFLSSMHLLGRTRELDIYCPHGLEEIIKVQLKYSKTTLNYLVRFHVFNYRSGELLFEDDKLTVTAVPLKHRIPCCGFIFKEKPAPRKIRAEMIEKYQIPIKEIPLIKDGKDFNANGEIIPNEMLTFSPKELLSYAYCSDTAYVPELAEQVRNITLLYHEATFLHELVERAKETYHSTAKQAAMVASFAEVKQLLIGHFSTRYKDLTVLLDEAREIFPNTELAEEGRSFNIREISENYPVNRKFR